METAHWIDWEQVGKASPPVPRAYFGHETCELLLPTAEEAAGVARMLMDRGTKATFVTPFLTRRGLDEALRAIDQIVSILGDLEVVCSDWGLLHSLCKLRICTPVVGRLISAQMSDPRLIRILQYESGIATNRTLQHIDGSICELRFRPPPPSLAAHFRSCWIDKTSIIEFMVRLGVHRCEISNVGQGLELSGAPGMAYSLNAPLVLVAVMRQCPGESEDFSLSPVCPCTRRRQISTRWCRPGLPRQLSRVDNALYYEHSVLPDNLSSLPIDRLVYNDIRLHAASTSGLSVTKTATSSSVGWAHDRWKENV